MRAAAGSIATLVALAALAAGAGAQAFTVSGSFQYVDKEWSYSGWTGEDPLRPIRRADVWVLDQATQAVLGRGFTVQDGSFSIACEAAGVVDVTVRCDAATLQYARATGFQPLRVTNDAGVGYAAFSPVFSGHAAPQPLDIGTVIAQQLLSGADEANPFNMLDMSVAALEYILGPEVGAAPAMTPTDTTLRILWPSPFGSLAFQHDAYIDVDDGYDDAVILHELGHVVQYSFSQLSNPGGTHSFGDSDEDLRLAFSEGHATFFGGCVLDTLGREGLYVDCSGSAQVGGQELRLRLETAQPYQNDAFGAADEAAVACTLFDLVDDELSVDASPGEDDDLFLSTTLINGRPLHRAWWELFVGPLKTAIFLNMNHVWDGWFMLHRADPHAADVKAVFAQRRLDFWADAQEPDNDRSQAVLTPATTAGTWTTDRTRYWSGSGPPVPGTDDEDWYAVELVTGSVVSIETRYPGNAADADTQCDTFLYVYKPSGEVAVTTDTGGKGRNAAVKNMVVTDTGTWHYVVATQSSLRRYGRYDVRTVYVSENHMPQVVTGPAAEPAHITDDQVTALSALASDPDDGQTLSYAWTPLDGGAIVGGGASVGFDPPAVTEPTLMRVQLIISDALGAVSAPLVADVRVDPSVPSPCALAASAVAFGTGKPGLHGTPMLSAPSLPVVPGIGFALHAKNCHPELPALLVFGAELVAAPFDGGTLYPSADTVLNLVTSTEGTLEIPLHLPASPTLCGLVLHCQLIVPGDPGAAGPKHTAQSNALTLRFGS